MLTVCTAGGPTSSANWPCRAKGVSPLALQECLHARKHPAAASECLPLLRLRAAVAQGVGGKKRATGPGDVGKRQGKGGGLDAASHAARKMDGSRGKGLGVRVSLYGLAMSICAAMAGALTAHVLLDQCHAAALQVAVFAPSMKTRSCV